MYQKLIVALFYLLILSGCSKEEVSVKPPDINQSYKIYEEGLNAMKRNEIEDLLLKHDFQILRMTALWDAMWIVTAKKLK